MLKSAAPSDGTTNSPASLVTEDLVSPVAGATTVTFAPGTEEPDWSVTVPEMIPVACPNRIGLEAMEIKQRIAEWVSFLMFINKMENGYGGLRPCSLSSNVP